MNTMTRKTRKVKPSLKLKINKSLKKANKINQRWTQKMQLEDNTVLKQILNEARNNLKEYHQDLLRANDIVDRLENNDGITDNDLEEALLELELIQVSIQSHHSNNSELKKKLQTLKTKGGKSKKYAYKKIRKTMNQKKIKYIEN